MRVWPIVMPALLVVANVLGAGMIVPQVLRFHRRRVVDGVSGTWIGIGVAMNAWWLSYGLEGQLWGLVPVSSVALVLYLTMAYQYASLVGRAGARTVAMAVAGIGSVPLVFLLLSGWTSAGLAIGLAYGVQFSPAALTAIRSADLTGISPTTWTMACIEAAIWFAYGLVEGDIALVAGGFGGGLMSAVVLCCLWRRADRPQVAAVID